MELILYWLFIINLSSMVVCIFDKSQAKRGGSLRVPENTLMSLGIAGGALGMYITMRLIRHKTLHKRFMIGLPIVIFVQAVILVWLLYVVTNYS